MKAKTLREPVRADLVAAAIQHPERWLRSCYLQNEASQVESFSIQPQQKLALDHLLSNRHSYILKYRQAKISTLAAFLLLHKTMYSRAMKSLLIANDEATARTLFGRVAFAYANMHPSIRIDVAQGPSVEAMAWPIQNGAEIKTLTGGGDTPAIGNSPDRYLITEYAYYKNQDVFNEHFLPTISKRPNSWGVIETTPGKYQSTAHRMWLNACAEDSESRFAPLFLEWWKDVTCTAKPPIGFKPDNEEIRLMEKYPGLSEGHIYFRRQALATEFARTGDRGFRNKYPFHMYDGWDVVGGTPPVPQEIVEEMLLKAVPTPDFKEHTFKPPVEGEKYVVTCDPNSYGRSGDPSAVKVWNRYDREEVWCFHGREDPGLLADRACKIASKYNDAYLMIESNKPECIASAKSLGYKNLYSPQEHRPGWFATETTKGDAVASMMEMLREREITLHSKSTCNQLAIWDGDSSKHGGSGKDRHHFDQVTCVYMAAWFFRKISAGLRPTRPKEHAPNTHVGFTLKQLDAYKKQNARKNRNVLGLYAGKKQG